MASDFIHLHLHSEYSLLDGLSKTSKLMKRLKELDMDSCAITDHGVMYGAIEFYKEARKNEIKPIIGMEAYTTLGDHKSRGEVEKTRNNHLLLLAKDEEGYKNIMKLTSIAHTEGYYYRPRFTRTLLEKYSKGIICTSACPAGEVGSLLIDGQYEKAKDTAKWFLDVFGKDYYLEIQRHRYEEFIPQAIHPDIAAELTKMKDSEKIMNEGVVKLSRELGIPLVATNDAHYINQIDSTAQDVLVCVSTGKQVADTKRIRFVDNPTFYVKSADEMKELFPDFPDAIANTRKIADSCDLVISTLGKWFFPKYELPEGVTAEQRLTDLAYSKMKERGLESVQAIERIEHELGIINQKGYASYFLIVCDMVNWANTEGIITNTRGSAAGSFVSFLLGITTVNPLVYYLPFERFLNPFRPTPPDIDFDVSDSRREEVIEYISRTYGHDKVAQICTFGRMLARAAVRDVARVLGYPYATGDKISKLVPPPKQGFPVSIPIALEKSPELKALYDADRDTKKIIDLAHAVEGSARHLSVHAAGVVVAPSTLTDFTPIQNDSPNGEKMVTQYEMHACEDVGLIKFDILGIRNLSILGSAIDIVKKRRDIKIDLHQIPLDDTKTFEMLSHGDTMGVFQLSSSGMTRYLKELKPNKIEDLMAMVALYRPGPMAVIPEYIARKNNPALISYLDSRMEKFLGASYGLIVYQDDLLFCALDLAGYTWEEADKFRKAVGKKIPEEMAAQKDKFTKGIVANGQTQKFADNLWLLFEPFQSYGFNKAHAASYGMVAYYTAYMKANYPHEYMTALLSCESGDTEKISEGVNECRRLGIKVLTPDINESDTDFTIVENEDSLDGLAIRFGLSAIKNVGQAAIESILEARELGVFLSIADFLGRVEGRKVNKKVLESLIKVGALTRFGNRAALLAAIDEIRSRVKPKEATAQQDLFGLINDEQEAASETVYTIVSDVPEMPDSEIENLERELLGFSLSAKPISESIGVLSAYGTIKIGDLLETDDYPELIKIACVVTETRSVVTKKTAAKMAFCKVEDGTGTLSCVVFPKLYATTEHLFVNMMPLLLTGKIENRDDEKNFLVESVDTVESAINTKREVFLNIPKGTSVEKLKELKQLLQNSPGNQQVVLSFEGENRTIPLKFGILWNDNLGHQISSLLASS